jgi:flagellar hook-length control protein FliK
VDRVVGAVRTSLAHGGMEVRLRLHPESLGEVRVQVRWEGGMVSARLEATTPAARETLEGGAQALRAALQDQGIPVERLSVGIRMDLQARSQGQELAERRHDFASRSESAAGDAPARAPEPMTPDVRGRGRLDLRI